MWDTAGPKSLEIGGARLECLCVGPSPEDAPTIVMLHEGLGSVGLWRDFPRKLTEATGHGVFAFSRRGYGRSDPAALPRPIDYMTREAIDVLPGVLQAIGARSVILLGHSDGATIASIYAGSVEDHRVRGLILMAPHFFAEPSGLRAIAEAKAAYEGGDLKARLAKHHGDVDNAFNGWCDAWLDPAFRDWNVEEAIAYIRVPVLALQGVDDQYGTVAQIDALRHQIYSPLDVEILADCRHSPFIEQPDKTLTAVKDFVARLDRIEAAADI